ncbi:MAG TPA: Bax inhibitor-1/YccA family protein [Candidatus Faecalibacterium intestinipullorum]|nr:Bax inhibitor-1/YccA family protein [Candidatus Faecalibacterium intestinipullorum]
MDYNNYDRGYAEPAMTAADYMSRTYRWMACGLVLTFATAFVTATSYTMLSLVSSLYLVLTIAELALVFTLSARVQRMSIGTARALFLAYSVLNGMVLSFYFIAFSVGTLVMAFLSSAVYFGLMALYGRTTNRDLTGWGPKLMLGLIALMITSLIGGLFGFGFGGSLLYSGIGLVVFMLLTAYDTQKLHQVYAYYAYDSEMAERASIYGALTLYLDFINIFLFVVRLMGSRSRD